MAGNAACMLQKALAEMESYYDEKTEAWQESERGEAHCQTMETLEEALAAITELL